MRKAKSNATMRGFVLSLFVLFVSTAVWAHNKGFEFAISSQNLVGAFKWNTDWFTKNSSPSSAWASTTAPR